MSSGWHEQRVAKTSARRGQAGVQVSGMGIMLFLNNEDGSQWDS